MSRSIITSAVLAAALVMPGTAAAQEQFQWSGRIAEGRAIEIKGINGAISATAAPGAEVRVNATKRGRRSDPGDVRVEVVEHAGGVTICAIYPAPAGRPANRCQPGSGSGSSVQNNDVQVEWTVQVPQGVHFVGRTVNGNVEASNLPADAEGRTVNGSVKLATAGIARANTVNGSVDVSMGRADWNGRLEIETVNGGVTIRFAAPLNAEVTASTVNGSIDSALPLQVQGRISPRRLTGTVGTGGRTLVLRTVNGGIRILQ
jgi:hypothetical protein